MPRSFGSLKSWENFVTPAGRRYKKTTKSGAACRLDDESVLDYFAENDPVLSEVEYEELQNPKPPAPAEPATPEPIHTEPDALPAPATPVDASEFDAAPPAPAEPATPPKSPKKK